MNQQPKTVQTIILIAILALVLVVISSSLLTQNSSRLAYSDVLDLFENERVESFVLQGDTLTMTLYASDTAQAGTAAARIGDIETFHKDLDETIAAQSASGILKSYNYLPAVNSIWRSVLPYLVVGVALLFVWFILMNRSGGSPNAMSQFTRANARFGVPNGEAVTFKDVAGADEEKEELSEIVEFLRDPDKFRQLGAKIPKGVLLVGPPGTGKTLLARAVAGEANVAFLSISGSDFVELYVGVGASRVRDLFDQAKRVAPAIVFIDEIDAVGRQRGAGLGGGHDEREQTLNQLLVEMFVGVGASRVRDLFQQAAKVAPAIIFIDEIDAIGRTRDSKFGGNDEREQTLNQLLAEIDGFDSSKGVVILAATNRPEILDKALLRAGRFDRRIIVDRPNLAGRYQTLRVHTKNIKLAEDVDLHKIAQATAGAVGADLANLVNEAALRAVRMGRKAVNQQDLLTSFELVIAGTEKKGTVLTDTEKRIVSYHEVGHALVAALQKHSQPVSKITIVPHTSGALGYTMQMPEEEKFLSSKEELIIELQTMLGGRAAEQVVFGIATTGASNDIERATELARKMVTQYGMSDKLGLMALSTVSNPYLDGSTMMNCADSTSSAADEEIHKLLMDCYADAKKLLVEHRSLLDEIAMYLLSKETITGDEFMAYVNADSKRLTDGSEAEEPPEQTEAPSESE